MRKHAKIRKMRKCDSENVCGSVFIVLYPSNFYPYRGLLNPDHPWSMVVRKTKMGMDRVMRSKEKGVSKRMGAIMIREYSRMTVVRS